MNSFFGDDIQEEENLLQEIIKEKGDEIPYIIKEIAWSKLSSNGEKNMGVGIKTSLKDECAIKNEQENVEDNTKNINHSTEFNNPNKSYDNDTKFGNEIRHNNEYILNVKLNTNIFPFHIKKNGKINSDIFFIPYKSEDNKDVITKYTYNYEYYDIYPQNIELTNKNFHANKKKDGDSSSHNNLVKCKKEDMNKEEENNNEKNNFQKFLVHFRGRLFIGSNINYSFFNAQTFLATLSNDDHPASETQNQLCYVNKKIQTYNMIPSATYWKQDEYPDTSDSNIQKLQMFFISQSIANYDKESQLNAYEGELVF
ncbi:ribonuclease H2 subunit C, putative [Plasmodium vinckei lentum]|uniref:Ribonuclease H2 subunit C, putative n=1 Tax=Plasmodium vinckei lentum TaxID=138297 RepID=A0A6V7S3F7_PLAVN|nr:ribonuclease H2 subunit C, putative [Plasmodium vinckei lentum]